MGEKHFSIMGHVLSLAGRLPYGPPALGRTGETNNAPKSGLARNRRDTYSVLDSFLHFFTFLILLLLGNAIDHRLGRPALLSPIPFISYIFTVSGSGQPSKQAGQIYPHSYLHLSLTRIEENIVYR